MTELGRGDQLQGLSHPFMSLRLHSGEQQKGTAITGRAAAATVRSGLVPSTTLWPRPQPLDHGVLYGNSIEGNSLQLPKVVGHYWLRARALSDKAPNAGRSRNARNGAAAQPRTHGQGQPENRPTSRLAAASSPTVPCPGNAARAARGTLHTRLPQLPGRNDVPHQPGN